MMDLGVFSAIYSSIIYYILYLAAPTKHRTTNRQIKSTIVSDKVFLGWQFNGGNCLQALQ